MKRIYLITGASSGIGQEFAQSLAKSGYDLILVARNISKLSLLKATFEREYQIDVKIFSCDLSKREQTMALIDKIAHFKIDGLINNAGYSIAREFHNSTLLEQADFIETCVSAPALLCHAILPKMRDQNFGRIINVSSIVAFANGAQGHTLYGAAKAFVLKMSRSLAAECADFNINILALCPGPTQSEFQIRNGVAKTINKPHRIKPMSANEVVEGALLANETKKEVLISGAFNKLSFLLLKFVPEFIANPIIRKQAGKYVIKNDI